MSCHSVPPHRYPLLVDPQGQGKRWIVQKESRSCVTTLQKKSFRSDLEEALQHGMCATFKESERQCQESCQSRSSQSSL